ncbi:helix-turn-helix transcriptional regulator [Cypionkella sp.]|uniref:helix-turn-helix domain-containing protein n=1 Tax=Cypionkella sp. TaxID=2811411 RepID=UPI0026273C9B|nr:helix-turn-helix transcriptional regulator [Cypionkella sp.]MDB5663549.1 helix-turn-helix protein [Cypionkella sp.]
MVREKLGPNAYGSFWPELIRTLRIESRLSQRQLSEKANVPRNTLRAIECGETSPQVHSLERILAVLGHDLDVMKAN